jgi:hypothetical protein
MEFPIHSLQEHHFILINLLGLQTRDLAPSTGGVVPILQVFRCKNQRGEKHTSSALHRSSAWAVAGLFHGEVMVWNVWSDLDEVVESDL